MSSMTKRSVLIFLAMIMASALSFAMRPPKIEVVKGPKVDLESVIPKQFGVWSIDNSVSQMLPPPDVQETLDRIYSQIVTRTYMNSSGQRIMLSIAYGDGFDKQLDIHRPEYCYPAQGFSVGSYVDQVISSELGDIPVRRMVATLDNRVEPVSYWITIGDTTLSSSLQRRLIKIIRRWAGKADSGMLVRVSSINPDINAAYASHEEFIRALVVSLPEENRKLIINVAKSN